MDNLAYMKNLTAFLLTILIFSQCSEEQIRKACSTRVTVRDLTGLDGCGFVFECGTPPLPKEVTEDPLFNFNFAEGKKVLISFELTVSGSICMAGLPAKITCVSEISPAEYSRTSGA